MLFPLLWMFDGTGVEALDPVWPQGIAVWTLLGVGVIAVISHLMLSTALKLTPAGTIAPLQYLEIASSVAAEMAVGISSNGRRLWISLRDET